MSEQNDIHPLVPPDIEREIFELTIRECPGTGPRLCLVARRVNTWIQPLLYTVIIYRGISRYPNFGKHKAERVRHLLLGGTSQDYQITWFIKNCSNLRSLALWPSVHRTVPAGEVKKALLKHAESRSAAALDSTRVGLTHLSIGWEKWFNTNDQTFKSPIFKNLTHLDLLDSSLADWDDWKGLVFLPSLTHLAINRNYTIPFLTHLLEEREKLVVVVILADTAWCTEHGRYLEERRRERYQRRSTKRRSASSDATTAGQEEEEATQEGYVKGQIVDGRLVFLKTGQAETEWHNAAHGFVSFWDRAEDMAYAQMAKSSR
ncbi:hypothetical protein BDN72DRAFT_845777 [Pluteus cervinus]|uniref:Uncharacterized protein n=1 Tax=Pluteus cervinus TaxID=181527 RepID=A0ACD3AHL1_9AGAR|nr:hypothetical protein BDN72DRAFT_845777 [Pluteus cervinus]